MKNRDLIVLASWAALLAAPGALPGRAERGGNRDDAIFRKATVLETRAEPADAGGLFRRSRMIRVDRKYPLLVVEETVRRDPATGVAAVLDTRAMAADHLIVKLQPGASESDLASLHRKHGHRLRKKLRAPGFYLVELPSPTLDALSAARDLYGRESRVVRFAEPDYIVATAATIPDDSQFSSLYGLHNTGQTDGTPDADIDAPEAWDIARGGLSILVGVIDTGIDGSHPDLAANLWTNPGESGLDGDGHDKRSNGLDDDHNGYVDDWRGWDFINNDNNPTDDNRHGTHCAGTIGGVGNNGEGVAGVCWQVSLVALKFLSSGGSGYTSDAIEAVYYATAIGCRLTSNSWGGGGYSAGLLDAIEDARAHGVLFVAAAGNNGSNSDAYPMYPAAYTSANIISVAATDHNDAKAGFSNYGATSVDLGAPGVNILSTTPGHSYQTLSGTSMATPHVAGAAALLWGRNPGRAAADIKAAILEGADPIPALAGITVSGGRLNVYASLTKLGLLVLDSEPAGGEVVFTAPTNFTVAFSEPYDPASVEAGDLSVNARPADAFTLTASNAVTFHFDATPVTAQGLQEMHMASNAVQRLSDGEPLHPWTASFRYDALALQVTGVWPAPGAPVSLPWSLLRLEWNEAVDPASVGADDLILSQGEVAGVDLVDSNRVEYTLAHVTDEGVFTFQAPAAALTDEFGNPSLAYTGSNDLDVVEGPFPVPLDGRRPRGSLVYEGSVDARISGPGDEDAFTLGLDANQIVAVLCEPDAGVQPAVELKDPAGTSLTNGAAAAPGMAVLLSPSFISSTGRYQLVVRQAAGGLGPYALRVVVNAGVESESCSGPSNNTPETAQDVDASFLTLAARAERGAVVGDVGAVPADTQDWYSFTLSAGDRTDLVIADLAATGSILQLYDPAGQLVAESLHDAMNVEGYIRDYAAPTGGVFRVRVAGAGRYALVLTRNLGFELEPNGSLADAQPAGASGALLGYAESVPEDGLALHYSFDTDHGAYVPDESGHGHTGVVAGAVYTTNGHSGGAYQFNGNGRIVLGNTDFVEGQTQLTFGAWIRPAVSHLGGIMGKTESGNAVFALNVGTPDNLYASVGRTDTDLAASDYGHVQTGAWQHVMATYDGTQVRLYHNGTLVETSAVAATMPTRANAVGVGIGDTSASRGWFFYGCIDDARIYHRALSAEEVFSLYQSSGAPGDFFTQDAESGDPLFLRTFTPADGGLEIANALDPALEVYNPAGALVGSDDNGAPDGRNASLAHTAATSGVHTIRIRPVRDPGEYLLGINLQALRVSLPENVVEGQGALAGAGTVSVGDPVASDTLVELRSDDPTELTVPASAMIPAGATSVTFDVTVEDDGLRDGSRGVTVTASNPSFTPGQGSCRVHDNESATLSVSIPGSATEGDGVLPAAGTVAVDGPVDEAVEASLASSDDGEALVPAGVVIPAGHTSAVFSITIVDDGEIDGAQSVAISAAVSNWVAGTGTIVVADNEDLQLRLSVPSGVTEGDGALEGAGRVAVSGVLTARLDVALSSSRLDELAVPPAVSLFAGQTSATFTITVQDDAAEDGAQSAAVEAAAPPFLSASRAVTVRDNDLHHLAWDALSSPQVKGQAFPVRVRAQTVDDDPAGAFTGSVAFTASGGEGAVPLQPDASGFFASGEWLGRLAALHTGTQVRLTADDGSGHSGQSQPFDVVAAVTAFTNVPAPFPGVSGGSVAWGDYDRDGDLDLFLNGDTGTSRTSRVFNNRGPGVGVSTQGLVLYYSFNTDSGPVVLDESGNGHTGTVAGAVYTTNGYSGGAYSFNGAGRIVLGDLDFVEGQTQLTFGAWIRTSASHLGGIMGKTESANAVFALNVGTPDNLYASIGRADEALAASDDGHVRTGVWQHVMATYDGTQVRLYHNGTLVETSAVAATMPTRANAVGIGIGDTSATRGWFFRGLIDDVRIYQRCLSATEVTNLYQADVGGFMDIGAALPGVSGGEGVWGDYDNDNDLDLFLTGAASTAAVGALFRNDAGIFTDPGVSLPGLSNSSAAWGDYDNDGDLDLLVTGRSGAGRVTKIYRNGSQGAPPVSSEKLALHYSFSTDSGSIVLDESGNGHTGTVAGAVYTTNGYSGGAYSFNGAGRIVLGNLDFVEGQTQLTFGAWIRTSASHLGGIMGKTESANAVFALNVGTPDNLYASIGRADEALAASDDGHVRTGVWQHVMATYDGTQVRLYYNGALVKTSSVAAAMATRNNAVGIGIGDTSATRGWFFRGLIDDVRIYQRCLSDGEVLALSGGTGSDLADSGIVLPGVAHGDAEWADYDNDGDLDILLTGESDGGPMAQVWRNEGQGVFSNSGAGLPGVTHSAAAWGDYDGDGDDDILLAGDSGGTAITRVYRNNGDGSFTDSGAALTGMAHGSAIWGDFDNDGDLDIMLAGSDGVSPMIRGYANEGGGAFQDIGAFSFGVQQSAAAWGDYDNDGDLDLVVAGLSATPVTSLFKNKSAVSNAPPTAPAGLAAQVMTNHVTLSWDPAADLESPAASLTYNLRAGREPQGVDVQSPMADAISGWRYVVQPGNARHRAQWTLRDLPPGAHRFSVQAVDASFAGSPFAADHTFFVQDRLVVTLPLVATEGDGVLPNGGRISVSAAWSSNVTISLFSGDTSEIEVPAEVTLPAGQTSIMFPVTIVDDVDKDGAQNVSVTATNPTYYAGHAGISVRDNELHVLRWAALPSPQRRGVPFPAQIRAEAVDGLTIGNYTGTVTLSAFGLGGPVPMTPFDAGPFIEGQWTGMVSVLEIRNLVTLTAEEGRGVGSAEPFDVVGPSLFLSPLSLTNTLLFPNQSTTRLVRIENLGNEDLTFTASVLNASGWLAVQPASGALFPGAATNLVVLFAATTGLLPGSHRETQLQVTCNDMLSPLVEIPVSLMVQPLAPEIQPEPPFAWGASNTLFWVAVPGASRYWAESSLNTAAAPIGASGWIVVNQHTFSELLTGHVYFYRVIAAVTSAAGPVYSPWSDWASSWQLDPAGDQDADGMPNQWEDGYTLNPLDAADARQDSDGDGLDNVSEYRADTFPRNPDSCFSFLGVELGRTNLALAWQGGTGVIQYIEHSDDLRAGAWAPIYSNLPPTPVTGFFESGLVWTGGYFRLRTSR